MKRLLVVFSCVVSLSVVAPLAAGASSDIRFWRKHHKEATETAEAPKPKAKRSLLHRGKASREQAARTEATYGMTGPKSVGWRHPQPGPAGFGAN